MDLTTLTDSEFEQHRLDVNAEQNRRFSLTVIPQQVAQLSAQFLTAGGDQAALDAAIIPEVEDAPAGEAEPTA